jgi:hypothetical protein
VTRLDRLARSIRDLLNPLAAITGKDYVEEALSYHPPENLTPGDSQTAANVTRCSMSLIREAGSMSAIKIISGSLS